MNLGGPIDLTPYGAALTGIGLLYWAVALGAAGVALWLPKRWFVKVPLAVVVLGVFIYPPVMRGVEAQKAQALAQAKLDKAMAMFAEHCKTAGERINRTVDNVEGVVWMKWRGKELNRDDQFKLDDPYGNDCAGDDCIVRLLRATKGLENDPQRKRPHYIGYPFVESIDPQDGKVYRYSMRMAEQDPRLKSFPRPVIEREPIERFTFRYGITWDDISTRADREYWIAGGSLKVIDLQTNEVIAERRGYMVDRGQGSTAGFRAPWLFAQQDACPQFSQIAKSDPRKRRADENRQFTFQILKNGGRSRPPGSGHSGTNIPSGGADHR